MAILLNEVSPETYNAYLLDYSTGTPGPNVTYFSSDVSLFFVKFNTKAALRSITMKFEFIGTDEFDTVRSISDFTAALMKSADFKLPDGFCYHCMLSKAGKPSRIFDNIYTADFTFVGYRHLPEKSVSPKSGDYIGVDGNYESSCVLSFRNQSAPSGGRICITSELFNDVFSFESFPVSAIKIDGIRKTVSDANGDNVFGNINLNVFPRLSPGRNKIEYDGVADLIISYLPIYV